MTGLKVVVIELRFLLHLKLGKKESWIRYKHYIKAVQLHAGNVFSQFFFFFFIDL